MATEVPFPDRPFYILSKLRGGESLALTLGGEGRAVLQPLAGDIAQLWTATPHPHGGSVLRHLASGLALTYRTRHYSTPKGGGYDTPEGAVHLTAFSPGEVRQVWRAEAVNGWVALNTRLDWEYKLNIYRSDPRGDIGVYRWDGGADNESWTLPVEAGEAVATELRYAHRLFTDVIARPPQRGPVMVVDNRAGAELLTDVRWTPRTYEIERAFVVDEACDRGPMAAFGQAAGFDKAMDGLIDGQTMERMIQPLPEGDPQAPYRELIDDPAQALVEVPPGRAYGYQAVVDYVRVVAPFTAVLRLRSAMTGRLSGEVAITGRFVGVNPARSEVQVQDLTAVGADGGAGELVGVLQPA
ncbi:hypothetical protein CFHF_03480 [Caulobacter flavus]|uniref:DUF4905 domain-containing protein n=1 Tax=Caulobacter flavus TaxID=1679497 RepID=A0A2N5CZ64_9CAUL|nr:hypothetical protein [Caulobacter flavus]AYV45237.1 hypothetical protein C1707_02690 [Caulobacter flavus]PLR19082.1 hypothetical protein CFHF_03480 [Caulobacter flavus]